MSRCRFSSEFRHTQPPRFRKAPSVTSSCANSMLARSPWFLSARPILDHRPNLSACYTQRNPSTHSITADTPPLDSLDRCHSLRRLWHFDSHNLAGPPKPQKMAHYFLELPRFLCPTCHHTAQKCFTTLGKTGELSSRCPRLGRTQSEISSSASVPLLLARHFGTPLSQLSTSRPLELPPTQSCPLSAPSPPSLCSHSWKNTTPEAPLPSHHSTQGL